MRYNPINGIPYDICPFCHQMILPKMFGGKDHINSHAIPQANRLFMDRCTIQQVNAHLSSDGITLYPNIPPQMRNVTINTIISYDGDVYRMIGFDHYEEIKLQSIKTRRIRHLKLWDRRFLALAKIVKE